jgi:hypothetical protein
MAIKVLFTLLMYKLLDIITDDKGRKTEYSTSLRQILTCDFSLEPGNGV